MAEKTVEEWDRELALIAGQMYIGAKLTPEGYESRQSEAAKPLGFDFVCWREDEFIVIDTLAGEERRKVARLDDGLRAEAGSWPYVAHMIQRLHAVDATLAERLSTALEEGKLKYREVCQPIEPGDKEARDITVNSFALKKPATQSKPAPAAELPLVPVLKQADWPHLQHAVHSPFPAPQPQTGVMGVIRGMFGPPRPAPLVVVYGYDAPSNYVFLTPDEAKKKPLAEWHKEALENTARASIKWEKFEDFMATASGHALSAEKILCQEFLLEAERLLGATELLVAVPRRTVLYVANAQAAEAKLAKFRFLHEKTWEDDSYGHAPITKTILRFKGGKFAGAAS